MLPSGIILLIASKKACDAILQYLLLNHVYAPERPLPSLLFICLIAIWNKQAALKAKEYLR